MRQAEFIRLQAGNRHAMPNFYEILGVSPSAGAEEVRAAFKRQALVVHPDKGGSS